MPPHATACPEAAALHPSSAPRWDVADIFRLYGETYRRTHPVPSAQPQVMHAIEACRTAQRGGHAEHLSLSRLNHWLPGREAHPEVV
jgi:hypothetical protein